MGLTGFPLTQIVDDALEEERLAGSDGVAEDSLAGLSRGQHDASILFSNTEPMPGLDGESFNHEPDREDGIDEQEGQEIDHIDEHTTDILPEHTTPVKPDDSTNVKKVGRPKGSKKGKSVKNTQICTAPTCPGRKSTAPLLRCCICMHWLHPQCIGDNKEDAEVCGTWSCNNCRLIPSQLSE